jgi:hypothetical protein
MTQYLISFGAHAMDHIPDEDAPAVARAARAAVQEAINAGAYVSAGGLENQPASIVATDGAVTTCPGAPLKRWSGGINAAVDGGGTFKSFGYMFREDRYLRFNWNPAGGGDPRADQPPTSIQDNWLGLAELLVAGQAKTQALAWTKAARSQLTAFLAFLSAGTPFPSDMKVFNTALATHFHVPPGASSSVKAAAVRQIRTAFSGIARTLQESATGFRFRTADESVHQYGNPAIWMPTRPSANRSPSRRASSSAGR